MCAKRRVEADSTSEVANPQDLGHAMSEMVMKAFEHGFPSVQWVHGATLASPFTCRGCVCLLVA